MVVPNLIDKIRGVVGSSGILTGNDEVRHDHSQVRFN